MTKMTLEKAVQISRRSLAGEEVNVIEARRAYDVMAAMPLPSEGEHVGLPVKGYRPQGDQYVRTVNANKIAEEKILRVIDCLSNEQTPEGESLLIDQRWLAIAKTDLEKGFMALNRAIFQPTRIEGDI